MLKIQLKVLKISLFGYATGYLYLMDTADAVGYNTLIDVREGEENT